MSITFTPVNGGPSVNLANGNARQVLDLLSFDGDWGEAPAEDFLGRVLIALALLSFLTEDDEGQPLDDEHQWIDCGPGPGYLADRLTDLHDIAMWAADHRSAVMWL